MTPALTLILGGGPAGLAAAVELARRGRRSVLVERRAELGGLARRLACKATEACVRCGVCLVDDLLAEVAGSPEVEVLAGWRLTGFERGGASAVVELASTTGAAARREVGAAVVAVGARPVDPGLKSQFGYGVLKDVISGLDLEEMVRRSQRVVRPSDGRRPERVAFIQCVGSRDVALSLGGGGQPGCSRVCCAYAARLAGWLARLQPGTRITIFYMDLQTFGRPTGPGLPDLAGVELVRAVPGFVSPGPEGSLSLNFKDEGGSPTLSRMNVDLLVLSNGLAGPEGAAEMAQRLGLAVGEDGFLSSPEGWPLVVAGSAGGPMGLAEAVQDGRLAASRLLDGQGVGR